MRYGKFRMLSIGQKVKELEKLLGTNDLTEWEVKFIDSILGTIGEKLNTTKLTLKQITKIETLHSQHFLPKGQREWMKRN